jgi:hypothetical protein
MDTQWEQSRFYHIWDVVCNFVPFLFRGIRKAGGRLYEQSVILSGLALLGDKLYIVIGLFFAVLIIAPHSVWNNAYAFAGMMVLLPRSYRPPLRRLQKE